MCDVYKKNSEYIDVTGFLLHCMIGCKDCLKLKKTADLNYQRFLLKVKNSKNK